MSGTDRQITKLVLNFQASMITRSQKKRRRVQAMDPAITADTSQELVLQIVDHLPTVLLQIVFCYADLDWFLSHLCSMLSLHKDLPHHSHCDYVVLVEKFGGYFQAIVELNVLGQNLLAHEVAKIETNFKK